MKNIKNQNFNNQNAIIRVDFNCPIKNGKVLDSFRIDQTIETFRYLLNSGIKKVIVLTHLGRPKSKYELDLSLKPVVAYFKEKMISLGFYNLKIKLLDYNDDFSKCLLQAQAAENGIVFFENIRFWDKEKQGDEKFSRQIAGLGVKYINDAFSVCHRNHASVTGVAQILPSYSGLLLSREIEEINQAIENPQRPAIAIVGGAKLDTKIPVLEALIKKYDKILVGGLVAVELEKNKEKLDSDIKKNLGKKIILPLGYMDKDKKDIDLESAQKFAQIIQQAKTILWNGPLGKFEEKPYHKGSQVVGKAVAQSNAYKITGGGETNELLKLLGVFEKIDFISTGGGAMLQYIGGEKLPGIEVLRN
ncbi:MAG: phosphoglycerate kinase [Candidatus Moranbacteria bacterium]|nr:phosphoglycerate kinase [Candidatus Moranbacteria bacterium]